MNESGGVTGFSSNGAGANPGDSPERAPGPDLPPEETASPGERRFTVDGRSWTARDAGEGLGGTGRLGIARFSLIHFVAEGETAPRYETLLPAGAFPHLFDAELARLLASARPLPPPDPR